MECLCSGFKNRACRYSKGGLLERTLVYSARWLWVTGSGGMGLAECHPIGTEVKREETSKLLGSELEGDGALELTCYGAVPSF